LVVHAEFTSAVMYVYCYIGSRVEQLVISFKMRVVILGHNIVARLALNVSLLSLCRIPPNLQIVFHGISGGWTNSLFSWRIPSPAPDLIFIQIGENEIGSIDPDRIIRNIAWLCSMFLHNGVSHVIVGALLPRLHPRYLSRSQYTRRLRYINTELDRILCSMPNVHFLRLVGFHPRYLHNDGVHFNRREERWFFQHIMYCINRLFFISYY